MLKKKARYLSWAVGLMAIVSGCTINTASLNRNQPLGLFNTPQLRLKTANFSKIIAPLDNPVTQAKVELGFRLWFEPRLSANNKMTCGTCHHHMKGFSNAEPNAAGVTGQRGNRNVPTIYQAIEHKQTFWDGRASSLEEQALGPIQNPIEMNETLDNVVQKLSQHPYYQQKFKEVFNTPPTATGIAKAIASFERALEVKETPFERYQSGDDSAMSTSQVRGMKIFMSRRSECFSCHRGTSFSHHTFHNIGVGMDKPNPDLGRYEVTKEERDKGSFKTPTLINIAKTGPYMHDGSMKTLEEVIDFYDKGGTPNANLDHRMRPLNLTSEEKSDLVDFLHALSAPDNLKELGTLPGIHLSEQQLNFLLNL